MRAEKIIRELTYYNIIQSEPAEYEPLKGGTVSELYLLNADGNKYVVKLNEPLVIKSEADFLNYYKKIRLLPKCVFVEPSCNYIVYSFINGAANDKVQNKKALMKVVVEELINHYKPAPLNKGFGWADQPVNAWESFLLHEVYEAYQMVNSRLAEDDYDCVCHLVHKNGTYNEPYLLHGDCGVHNFIFNDGQLSGVIDPNPVIGDPLYDLIYAFCSSPADLTKETIDSAARRLMIKRDMSRTNLYEQVMIGLYLRLGRCMKHHPEDLEDYLKAWHYWKSVIK